MEAPTSEAGPERVPAVPGNRHVAVVLAWLVPGLGHLYLGRRARAAAFAVIVAITLVLGCRLEGELYHSLGQPLASLATGACAGMGLVYFVLLFGLGYTGNLDGTGYEYGKAFILTAGLMNILLILDAWDIGSGEKE